MSTIRYTALHVYKNGHIFISHHPLLLIEFMFMWALQRRPCIKVMQYGVVWSIKFNILFMRFNKNWLLSIFFYWHLCLESATNFSVVGLLLLIVIITESCIFNIVYFFYSTEYLVFTYWVICPLSLHFKSTTILTYSIIDFFFFSNNNWVFTCLSVFSWGFHPDMWQKSNI